MKSNTVGSLCGKRKQSPVQDPFVDKIFYAVNYIFLAIFFIAVLYPLIYVLSASFSEPDAVNSGRMWLFPVGFTLDGYKVTLGYKSIQSGYLNSIIYTTIGTVFTLILTILTAFPLSRRELYGRKFITWLFFITSLFSGGLIPTYLVVKNFGMVDTIWSVTLVGCFGFYNAIVMRSFFQSSVPEELIEAAQIDGYSYFGILLKIVLPLSKAVIAIIALFAAVASWNSFFNALIYLSDSSKFPLQLILREILILNQMDASALKDIEQMRQQTRLFDILRYASIVVSVAPLLAAYPFVQKYFVKGVLVGSVKG